MLESYIKKEAKTLIILKKTPRRDVSGPIKLINKCDRDRITINTLLKLVTIASKVASIFSQYVIQHFSLSQGQ